VRYTRDPTANAGSVQLVRRTILPLVAALALDATTLAGSAQTARPTAIVACLGQTSSKPVELMIACGDGNVYAQRLRWTGWGEPFAAAVGDLHVNSCTPNCAAGTFTTYRAVLLARNPHHCKNGVVAYATVEIAFVGKMPSFFDSDPLTRSC
jgi:hypothetical protein